MMVFFKTRRDTRRLAADLSCRMAVNLRTETLRLREPATGDYVSVGSVSGRASHFPRPALSMILHWQMCMHFSPSLGADFTLLLQH
jgi:hypothetical protein